MKLEHKLILYTKMNTNLFKDLNVRQDTIKYLQENIGIALLDINHRRSLLIYLLK